MLLLAPAAGQAERTEPTAVLIAIPPLATAENVDTDAGKTWSIANQIAQLITSDLKTTTSFIVADSSDVRVPSYPEITAPAFAQWRAARAKFLLSGFVNARNDGRLTVGCYLYDVQSGREVARQGFAVSPSEWRRAAHRCADTAFTKVTGNSPQFDSRIAYVTQSGRDETAVKRLAVMDFDGANHQYLTSGDSIVLSPKWSPDGNTIAYTSYEGGDLNVRIFDVSANHDRPLLAQGRDSFGPAFSPDGRTVALSMATAGNTDVFTVSSGGGFPRQLTNSPAIDTGPSFSPDGDKIVFVSDRSGSPQLYVMDTNGSNQRRISFGPGVYGSPAWSPDGERIAFTKTEGALSRIGTMATNGADERIVTGGPNDEQPTWSPGGTRLLFQRQNPGTRRMSLASVPAEGGEARQVVTPQEATDPSWAERKE